MLFRYCTLVYFRGVCRFVPLKMATPVIRVINPEAPACRQQAVLVASKESRTYQGNKLLFPSPPQELLNQTNQYKTIPIIGTYGYLHLILTVILMMTVLSWCLIQASLTRTGVTHASRRRERNTPLRSRTLEPDETPHYAQEPWNRMRHPTTLKNPGPGWERCGVVVQNKGGRGQLYRSMIYLTANMQRKRVWARPKQRKQNWTVSIPTLSQ